MDKSKLLSQIIDKKTNKYIFFPLDFGFYKSPTSDLVHMDSLITNSIRNKWGTMMLHKGLVKRHSEKLKSSQHPFFLHLTGSTGLFPTIQKVKVASVEEACELGAIGVSTLIYLGNPYELEMLEMLAKITERADKLGLLVYTMIYVSDIKNCKFIEQLSVESIRYAARVGYELGVDIVETRMPEDTEDFQSIKQMCPVPLIFGDRSHYSEDDYVNNIKITTRNSYDGVSISNRSLNTSFEQLITLTNKGLKTT